MNFAHKPVLLYEIIDLLDIDPTGVYVDGTAGGGGHSAAILEKLTAGKLILIDRDPDSLALLHKRFFEKKNVFIINSNFAEMASVINIVGISSVNGVILDLGVSSYQLDEPERGFSYKNDAKLDMRMSKNGISAYSVVNEYSQEVLSHIIWSYGEEKFSRKISKAIVDARKMKPVKTTLELANIIKSAIPAAVRRKAGHPAKKTFQAIRIEVNNELQNLCKGLEAAFSILKPGGRLAVISFHSLEDRIVKKKMASWFKDCVCPADFPVCVCDNRKKAEPVNKNPIVPSFLELNENRRCKSAKLRVIMKI
ncbi:MAG: 16S rRNA (cytosine(1402)-N(4))-methyltransferase RsmH [Oscillospiraceae bacterium]|jgi:16S rRNA (cytosine1402-N4)-methyltransferase|nr:16S rRNA (cytosine(1402)-N(4))-methyltransferase RsmH [Oscillospiraceae bacterium]